MAKLTWLGTEDYREGESPLESCTWNGVLFTAGDRVEVSDEWMIAKARGNRFFRVEEEAAKKPAPEPQPVLTPAFIGAMPAKPEMWTNDPVETWPAPPPDYPPEDEPERPSSSGQKRRGRPPRIRDNGDGD